MFLQLISKQKQTQANVQQTDNQTLLVNNCDSNGTFAGQARDGESRFENSGRQKSMEQLESTIVSINASCGRDKFFSSVASKQAAPDSRIRVDRNQMKQLESAIVSINASLWEG